MNMKEHILTALKEQFNRWEELLTGMSDEQISAPQMLAGWSIKDVVVHLWAWQQRSIARLEAALFDRVPEFPQWLAGVDLDSEDNTDQINAWIYETYREQPWSGVYPNWQKGFLRLLELGAGISEKDLLDADRYPWLAGHPLAFILLASYDHHQEHLEKLPASQAVMIANRSMPPGVIIPELAYSDVATAVTWLCQTFGFKERLRIGDHRAQLTLGEASIIVVEQSRGSAPHTSDAALPSLSGIVTHSIMVRVEDVDRHHAHVTQCGAQPLQPPQTYRYGERQYTVTDPGGHRWTFSQSVADVDPEEWGGQLK
jgi:uncharacterized glyoxalase superfamily protein PhnB